MISVKLHLLTAAETLDQMAENQWLLVMMVAPNVNHI